MNTLDDLMNTPDGRCAAWLLRNATQVGECLECHLSNVSKGYCKVKGFGSAHRQIYRAVYGEPGELFVLHKCDNRRCIKPEHLFLGTQHDNVLDMMAKGRQVPSKGPGFGTKLILSPKEIEELLALSAAGATQRELGNKYGMHQTTVTKYLKRARDDQHNR